jgi:tetratricopeptide (TPR) repeat protein
MTLPPSRLLQRLDADIAAERNPFRADILRAERAACLARQGETAAAARAIADLHERYDVRPNIEVSAWVSLAESLLSYFSDMGPAALDKMRRSRALSEAAGLLQLQALSSAWLAHMDYLRLDLSSMSKNLVSALILASKENHSAQARAALVVAQGYHTAVRLDLALPWYERARWHALEIGDDATVSALMHNMAWIRTTNMRNAALTGSPDDGEGEHALLAAESTWSFDKLTGATSLDSYVPLLHAQILTLREKYEDGLTLYEKYLGASAEQGLKRLEGLFLADQAWCRLKLEQRDRARLDAEGAQRHLEVEGNCDDRAPGFSRLSQVFMELGDHAAAKKCDEIAAELWQEHSAMCTNLIAALEPTSIAIHPEG